MNKPTHTHQQLILASASPRRSELLERIGLQFRICPADVEEYNSPDDGPAQMVVHNAGLKADALATDFPRRTGAWLGYHGGTRWHRAE